MTGSVKTSHARTQTEFILFPQHTATLNNYISSLPPLVNTNWSALQSALCRPCNYTSCETVPLEGSKLAVGT